MSEVSYDNFLVEVLPYVRDIPEVVALQAIKNAAIEFCQETRYIQDNLDAMAGITKIGTYDLEANEGTYKIADIVECWYGEWGDDAHATGRIGASQPLQHDSNREG